MTSPTVHRAGRHDRAAAHRTRQAAIGLMPVAAPSSTPTRSPGRSDPPQRQLPEPGPAERHRPRPELTGWTEPVTPPNPRRWRSGRRDQPAAAAGSATGRPAGRAGAAVVAGGLVLIAARAGRSRRRQPPVRRRLGVATSRRHSNHTLGGMLTGHPGRGLPPSLARRVPSPAVVYCGRGRGGAAPAGDRPSGCGRVVARYVRPGDARAGMASRAEAAAALGVGQLRRARAIIRPRPLRTRRDQRPQPSRGRGER